jgi:hypothetical protein
MNEMDQLTRFRDAVPPHVTPRAEQLFLAGLREDAYPERIAAPRPGRRMARIGRPWRFGIAATAAAALAAGVVVAVQPSAPFRPAAVGSATPSARSTGSSSASASASAPATAAQLLADRASAAALTQPAVSGGQWVYRVVEWSMPFPRPGRPKTSTEAGWETADGMVTYGDNASVGVDTGDYIPAYSQLGSLPTSPAALNAYLVTLVYPNSKATPLQADQAAFSVIDDMLENYVLPPKLQAEVYQALAAIPVVTVDPHVTAIDGQSGVAFVMPATPQSEKQEIILRSSDYRFLGHASWGASPGVIVETAVKKMVIVGAPGSTQPSLTPPTAAELLAEQADRAVTFTNSRPLFVQPGTWVLRELDTSSGPQTIWATADDSEQASYVNGKLVVCLRSAPCATSTQWLMPVGPGYTLVNPPIAATGTAPSLPDTLPELLAALNAYQTGCSDVSGDCNAVNALLNIMFGYANRGGTDGNWFLMLADVPGVTQQPVTDVTGQADVAFGYPFSDGVTQILFNASTHLFVGYVRNGAQTIVTKEVPVSGPGSTTPANPRASRP